MELLLQTTTFTPGFIVLKLHLKIVFIDILMLKFSPNCLYIALAVLNLFSTKCYNYFVFIVFRSLPVVRLTSNDPEFSDMSVMTTVTDLITTLDIILINFPFS